MSLAEDIKRNTGVEPQLVRGAGGIFDVSVDGTTVFSKHREHRFPTPDEILDKLPD